MSLADFFFLPLADLLHTTEGRHVSAHLEQGRGKGMRSLASSEEAAHPYGTCID